MPPTSIRIVQLGPRDWRTFKAIRLEAFRREPAAFSSTYAEARARPDESWQHLLANPRRLVLAALAGECVIGVVGAWLGGDDGDDAIAVIFGMYVSEEFRGQGVGTQLLSTLIAQLSEYSEIQTIRLWVSQTQAPARRLYESLGFREVAPEAFRRLSDTSPDDGSEPIMERPLRLRGAETLDRGAA